jgi:hypothetical protein
MEILLVNLLVLLLPLLQVEAAAKEVAKELVVGLEDGVAAVGSSSDHAAAAAAAAAGGAAAGGGLFALREAAGQLAARAERSLEVGWWLRLTTECLHVAAACTRMCGIGCLMYESMRAACPACALPAGHVAADK